MLRKSFLIIGIVLLVLGFFFFYWASRVNWDYVTKYNDEVNLAYPTYAYQYSQFGYPQWGYSYEFYIRDEIMQPNEVIIVSYPVESTYVNGTIRIVIEQYYPGVMTNETILDSSDYGYLYWTNNKPYSSLIVDVYLVAQNMQNVTVSTTTEVHHYETPQWVYFGIGVVLASLAVIPVFKSKK